MTENELRNMVAGAAESYAASGEVYEWSPLLKRLIEKYNAYPDIGRGIQYKPTLGGWCALFASVLFIEQGMADLIIPEIGAYEMEANAKKAGIFRSRESGYIPKRGDLIHYAFPRMDESGKYFTQYHIGVVTNADANVVYTTEGNVTSRVVMKEQHYYKDVEMITGFSAVPYESKVIIPPELPPLPKETGLYIPLAMVDAGKGEIIWQRK